jgi:hypothetical protein
MVVTILTLIYCVLCLSQIIFLEKLNLEAEDREVAVV